MFQIRKYEEKNELEWDDFIVQKSINGSFLQSRRFLNYHPKGKFIDDSLMIYDNKDNLCAVVPACIIYENEKKIFYSHKGSTFGGVVIDRKHYRAKYLLPMMEEMIDYLREEKYSDIYIKNSSYIFCKEPMDLFGYLFQYYNFIEYKELSTYIDFSDYKEDILANFSQGKRTNVHNCEKKNLYIRKLEAYEDMRQFYAILCENLSKYDVKPVHTIEELVELKDNRLKEECEFFGCFLADQMIAGCMMFYFNKIWTAHTQYLAADGEYNQLSPMTFLYYSMIKEMRSRGYKKLSWGIVTEHNGSSLNMGLVTSKEDYGSKYCNNSTYYCRITG